ncbi:two-component sensor histidine kinase [Crocosphaera subtropica ATCC 51142]|uniref:histidine kinase n=1 Tax=Crocosphaera subtropica (strain ATCC 51142 / BH68) TaxID=43989 RepID=B1WY91_CROS5|nr:ATP-binding protein [Crocosphaera subtropica]ACB52675.1 two-component sensor histidine kinase [Crocosphaera subtropica ATCC 51142]
MFSATASLPNPSQDFIALCQSQVMLLGNTLQADWSAVYLTSEEQGQPVNLIPVVIYPLQETAEIPSDEQIQLTEGKQEVTLSNLSKSLPSDLSRSLIIPENDHIDSKDYQIVLPLVYQEVVLGVLVTRREAYPWKPEEFNQIEKIADTLAIARLLDQRQGWYQKQLQLQQRQQQQERDRLDDLFHQLRNPLTALKVFGKLLLKRLGTDDQSRSIVNNIVREGEHLQELIKEFESHQKGMVDETDIITLNTNSVAIPDRLSPSLPPSQSLELSPINLWDILETVIMSAESIAENKGIDLQVEKFDHLDAVLGNKSALREVLSNLIDNSIKYTPASGKVRIKLGLSKVINDKRYQGILIEDTGYGIPREDQEHIFERHYRGSQENSEIAGSGLGLAIVKELVTQMGGLIELSSPINLENKTGTRIILWLINN